MTNRGVSFLSLGCLFLLMLQLTACGSGSLATISSSGSGGDSSVPSIVTSSLPNGTMGASYSAGLEAKGGKPPYAWSLKSGSLPAGLTLSREGAVTGTPAGQGTFKSLIFQITDANDALADSSALSIRINPTLLRVMTSSLPGSEVGAAYSLTLLGTGGTAPYRWSVKSGTLPAGLLLNPSTGAITGVPTASGTFASLVFQLTDANQSVADSSTFSLQVMTPPSVVTAFLPMDNAGTAYSVALQANGGTLPYRWSLVSGTLPAGLTLNSATGAVAGIPTTPTINSLVFKVTDAFAVSAASGFSLQINNVFGCSAGVESKLGTGPYAFLLKGYDINGVVAIAGSFVTDGNGNIVSGEQDANRTVGAQSAAIIGGTYSLGADNRGCLNLTTASGTTGFRYSVGGVNASGAFTTGQITEFDDSNGTGTRGSGMLRLQSASTFTTGLTGMYAFLFTGADSAGGRIGIAGSLSASANAFSNLALDYDDAGALGTNLTGGSGAFTNADSSGRGTASFSISGYNLNTVFYLVNSTEAIFASTDPISTNPINSGEALATSGPFSAANLSGNYVAHGVGLAVSDTPAADIATVSFDGVSATNGGTLFQYRGGIDSQWQVHSSYVVDPVSGRVAFTGNFITPVGYLVTGVPRVSAFLIGDDFPGTSGVLSVQTSAQPSAGNYTLGTEEDVDYKVVNQDGEFHLNAGMFSGTQDVSVPAVPFLEENQTVLSTPYQFAADGTGIFGANTVAVSDGSAIYIINESPANSHPSVTILAK